MLHLQGVLTARMIRNFTENKAVIIIVSVIFEIIPTVIWRMFVHTSLAGQWILLLGLEILFVHKKYQHNKKIYMIVGLMGILSACVHMYFVLMSGIILLGICLTDILVYRRIKRSGLLLAEYLVIVAVITWLLGGFDSGMPTQAEGLGIHSSNINTFFNPQGYSRIYKDLPLYGNGQYEGFGYLGGGGILLLLLSVICLADETIQKCLWRHRKTGAIIILVVGMSMIVALSPTVTMGSSVILQMQLPQRIENAWSVFRASGRIIWVAVYIIMFASSIVIIKTFNKRLLVAVFSIVLLIQVYDSLDALKIRYATYGGTQKYVSILTENDLWDYIAQRDDIQHIVYYSIVDKPIMYSITDWAIRNGKTVNNFYFARLINDKVSENREEVLKTLPEDTIFIFNEYENEGMYELQNVMHYYPIDGLVIGYRDKIPGYRELSKIELY